MVQSCRYKVVGTKLLVQVVQWVVVGCDAPSVAGSGEGRRKQQMHFTSANLTVERDGLLGSVEFSTEFRHPRPLVPTAAAGRRCPGRRCPDAWASHGLGLTDGFAGRQEP